MTYTLSRFILLRTARGAIPRTIIMVITGTKSVGKLDTVGPPRVNISPASPVMKLMDWPMKTSWSPKPVPEASGVHVLPPLSVTSTVPRSPATIPLFSSLNFTAYNWSEDPLSCLVQVIPPSSVASMFPAVPTLHPLVGEMKNIS